MLVNAVTGRPANRVGLHRNRLHKEVGTTTEKEILHKGTSWTHILKTQPDHNTTQVIKTVFHTCRTYLLWYLFRPAALACLHGAANTTKLGEVIGKESQQTFPLVKLHCLILYHLHRHSGHSQVQATSQIILPVCSTVTVTSGLCNQVHNPGHNPVRYMHTAFACWIFDSMQLKDFFFQTITLLSGLPQPSTPPLMFCQIRWNLFSLIKNTDHIHLTAWHGYLSVRVCISALHNFFWSNQCAGLCSEEDVLWWSLVRTLPW